MNDPQQLIDGKWVEAKPIPFREYNQNFLKRILHIAEYLMCVAKDKDVDFTDWAIWKHGKDKNG